MNPNDAVYGKLHFVKDEYFVDFPYDFLMENKDIVDGKIHNRPCFYSAIDAHDGIIWLVPVSSKIEKYQEIYDKKVAKNKEVDTIVFGYVRGNRNAFLIQNMFPITLEYLNNVYIDVATNKPVTLSKKLKEELERKAKKVLNIQRRGQKLIFPDVLNIEKKLLEKLAESGFDPAAPASEIIQDEIAKQYSKKQS